MNPSFHEGKVLNKWKRQTTNYLQLIKTMIKLKISENLKEWSRSYVEIKEDNWNAKMGISAEGCEHHNLEKIDIRCFTHYLLLQYCLLKPKTNLNFWKCNY